VYEPLLRRRVSQLMLFVASLGVVWAVENAIEMYSRGDVKYILQGRDAPKVWQIGALHISAIQAASIVAAAISLALVLAFLNWSRYGLAIRAVSDTESLARVVGVRTRQARLLAFAVGSAMAVPAAVIFGLTGGITAYFGSTLVFLGIAATFVGGVGSIPGAIVGGVAMGLAQTVPLAWLPAGWQTGTAFGLILLVLVVRPSGLFGRRLASMNL
jgi:branched-subunit amino acid ABC-type transport system permease component